MKTIFRLAKTELRILFCSPVSWLILVIFAFQAGLSFSDNFGGQLKRQALEYGLGDITLETFAGYVGLMTSMVRNLYLYIPLITMGLMSRELSSGSIKFLYSSPITTRQIILGKYLSMMIYGAMLLFIGGVKPDVHSQSLLRQRLENYYKNISIMIRILLIYFLSLLMLKEQKLHIANINWHCVALIVI